jgi:PAS domain S-box-containing protein
MMSHFSSAQDDQKSREQLIAELTGLRSQVAGLKGNLHEYETWKEEQKLAGYSKDMAGARLVWITPEGRYKYWNARCYDLGYSREELASIHVWDIDPNYSEKKWPEEWNKLKKEGTVSFESVNRRKDGTTFPVKVTVDYFTFMDKEYIFARIIDISERKREEETRGRLLTEIEDQRNRLEAILRSLPVGVVIVDTGGRIILANQIACEYNKGYMPEHIEDIVKDRARWADTGISVDIEKSGVGRALSKGETTVSETHDITNADGTAYSLINSVAPVKDANGNITAAVIISQDITERIKLEKELSEAKQQVELYLDLMTHDINNLNQVAMGNLELAGEMLTLDSDEKELIARPLEALKSSTTLIENVHKLRMAKGDEFQKDLIDLGEVISRIQKQYHDPDGEVVIGLEPENSCHVMANGLIEDVFTNLVGNAIKHSAGRKPVEINIKMDKAYENNEEHCRVAIEDNGPGIPDDMKDKLFDRLRRGKTKASGKGLGLYLVKTLVEEYHGRVWVEDRIKGDHTRGARFVVSLPTIDASLFL